MKFSKEEVAQVLISLGYKINRSWKFKLRPGEKTPSASINPRNGSIKDFGDGFYGSIIDVLKEYHNMSLSEAFNYIKDVLSMDISINFKKFEKQDSVYKSGFIPQKYIESFELERKENFPIFWKMISKTFPALNNKQKKDLIQKHEIGYSFKANRLIMPIKDKNGNILTLWKYNPEPNSFINKITGQLITPSKVKFTKNRKRRPFNLQDLISFRENLEEYVLIMEGEKDCLNALGLGLRAISIGSASQLIAKEFLYLFKDLKILICYDFDEAGRNGAEKLKNQLINICSRIKIIDWEKKVKGINSNFKPFKGFDFTDYLILKNR